MPLNGKKQELIISRPKPPVSDTKLVFIRSFTVLFLLLTAILMHICVIYRPWRVEWLKNPTTTLEFSVWKVCRATKKSLKCYEGEYDNAPAWFLAFRWFLILAVIIQYLSAIVSILKIALSKNSGRRDFWISAFMSLTSAIFTLTAMLLLVGYRDFEFLDDSRMYRMGWRMDDTEGEESWGYPFYLSWCAFVICLVSFVVCMYAQVTDSNYAKYSATEGLRKQAEKMMR